MKGSALITHSLCLLLGWVLVSLALGLKHSPNSLELTNVAKSPRPHSSLQKSAPPLALLATLARESIDPKSRRWIKLRILWDWAENDPVGLLEHLENRAWPTPNFGQPFSALAKSNPDYLLDYARREGCPQALRILSKDGDPRTVLDLFLAQAPRAIPEEYFGELFEAGGTLDPEFHVNLQRIQNPDQFVAAFRRTSEILLAHRRPETYLTLVEENLERLSPEWVAEDFAYQVVQNELDVGLVGGLPAPLQEAGLDQILQVLDDGSSSDAFQRTSLNILQKNGWLSERVDATLQVIKSHAHRGSHDASHLREAAAWRDWALALPNSEANRFLREAGVRRWIVSRPDSWQEIAELPSQSLRDVAYTAVLYQLDLTKHAEQIEWITRQINDEPLRRVAENIVAERIEYHNEEDPDPFRADTEGDPFKPFAEDTPEPDPFAAPDPFGED